MSGVNPPTERGSNKSQLGQQDTRLLGREQLMCGPNQGEII